MSKAMRLPPQPTDTALARFVRRLVDGMPWVMARDLREARAALARAARDNLDLHQQNCLLRRDYLKLMSIDQIEFHESRVDVELYDYDYTATIQLSAECRPYRGYFRAPRRYFEISGYAAEALKLAATEILRAAEPHQRDLLISHALRGRTIEQVLREKKVV